MRFIETRLQGAVLIELTKHTDSRGFFARTFCKEAFSREGLAAEFVQSSHSSNRSAGTLRGMHCQRPPYAEAKLVRVAGGAIHDVIVDLRPDSPTYRQWEGFDLDAADGRMLYVPEGFAHGFQTLTDSAEVVYQISAPYVPEAQDGVRWDDPALGIVWPLPVSVISDKDAAWPLLNGDRRGRAGFLA